MRKSASRVLVSSSRPIISVSESAAVCWVLFCDREEEGGEPCGRVNIVQNQAGVILSVIEGTEKSTPLRELSTMSASKENMG